MALTPDQTAVLELLLAGQSYADLEGLLGISQDEVRARARAALTELGGADPDRNVGLSDYLLGQADPIGRADAVRHLRQDAGDHALAARVSERLAELAPAAELPKLPPAPGGGSFLSRSQSESPADAAERERRSPLAGIPRERGRLYAALGAGAVIVIAIVLGVSGVFSGDDELRRRRHHDNRRRQQRRLGGRARRDPDLARSSRASPLRHPGTAMLGAPRSSASRPATSPTSTS